jgi:hypothetical protein
VSSQPGSLDRLEQLRAHPDRRTAGSLGRLQDLESFQHARQTLLARDAVAVELHVSIAETHAQVEATAGSSTEVLGDGSQAMRILHGQEQHPGADPQPVGDRQNRCRRRQKGRTVTVIEEVVFGKPELVISELLHQHGILAHVPVCSRPVRRQHSCVLKAEEANTEAHRDLPGR